jgi:chromosome segregation ATPase
MTDPPESSPIANELRALRGELALSREESRIGRQEVLQQIGALQRQDEQLRSAVATVADEQARTATIVADHERRLALLAAGPAPVTEALATLADRVAGLEAAGTERQGALERQVSHVQQSTSRASAIAISIGTIVWVLLSYLLPHR